MKRKLTENISLKILSVVVAILVWLIVVNVDNPVGTRQFVLDSVDLINQAYIDQDGKMCLPDADQGSVRVYITGARKTLEKIKAADIHAVADLQQAVSLNTSPVMVPITVTCDGISASNIEVVPGNFAVYLQEKETKEFAVSVTSGDSRPARGYEIGSITSNPEKIKITGPKTLISKIDTVTAAINVEGQNEDVVQESSLVIYDKNGDPLTETRMSYLNLVSKVTVTAKLWNVRTNVKLAADCSGNPAEGYQVDSITKVPDTISVAGSRDALASLEENGNEICIPAEYIDISGASSDVEVKVNITQLLPDGLKLPSGSSEDVWVRVNILPEGSHAYAFSTQNIKVENQPENMQVTFGTDKIEIRIKGEELPDNLADLKDLQVSVDLTGKEAGNYELPVKISLPEEYELVEAVTAEVQISEISTVESSEE